MRRQAIKTLAIIFFAICLFSRPLVAADAAEILANMDAVLFAPDDQRSTVEMILTDRSGNERTREAEIWQKGTYHRLFRFTAPAGEAGIAFLSLPNDVMYLYMPAFGRERRIASHVKNQSFAGTDFTYEDLESVSYTERYEPRLLEETNQHYIMELKPLPGMRSDYSKVIAHINKEHYYPIRMESYDRGGRKAKIAEYIFKMKNDYWYMQEVTMQSLQRQHSTRMIFSNVTFDTGIDDAIFTIRNLTRY